MTVPPNSSVPPHGLPTVSMPDSSRTPSAAQLVQRSAGRELHQSLMHLELVFLDVVEVVEILEVLPELFGELVDSEGFCLHVEVQEQPRQSLVEILREPAQSVVVLAAVVLNQSDLDERRLEQPARRLEGLALEQPGLGTDADRSRARLLQEPGRHRQPEDEVHLAKVLRAPHAAPGLAVLPFDRVRRAEHGHQRLAVGQRQVAQVGDLAPAPDEVDQVTDLPGDHRGAGGLPDHVLGGEHDRRQPGEGLGAGVDGPSASLQRRPQDAIALFEAPLVEPGHPAVHRLLVGRIHAVRDHLGDQPLAGTEALLVVHGRLELPLCVLDPSGQALSRTL